VSPDAAADVGLQLAEIKGILQATLPNHTSRLDEHDRRIGEHDTLIREMTAKSAADAAAATAKAAAEAAARRLPNWVPITAMALSGLIGAAGLLVALLAR
jgi:hypothetical protein